MTGVSIGVDVSVYHHRMPPDETFAELEALQVELHEKFQESLARVVESVRFWEPELRWAVRRYPGRVSWSLGGSWNIFLKVQLPPDEGFGYLHELYDKLAERSGRTPSHQDFAEIRRRHWTFFGKGVPHITLAAFFDRDSEVCRVVEKPGIEREVVCADGPQPVEVT